MNASVAAAAPAAALAASQAAALPADYAHGAGASDAEAIAAARALLQRQPELQARAARLAAKQVPAIERVPFDDLPREAAARAARLQRAEELESLVRVKDSMLWSALQEGRAQEASASAFADETAAARAHAEALRAGAETELSRWEEVADAYAAQARRDEAELHAARAEAQAARREAAAQERSAIEHAAAAAAAVAEQHAARSEAARARAVAEQLSAHNQALVAHAEQLRAQLSMLVPLPLDGAPREAGAVATAQPRVAAATAWRQSPASASLD